MIALDMRRGSCRWTRSATACKCLGRCPHRSYWHGLSRSRSTRSSGRVAWILVSRALDREWLVLGYPHTNVHPSWVSMGDGRAP